MIEIATWLLAVTLLLTGMLILTAVFRPFGRKQALDQRTSLLEYQEALHDEIPHGNSRVITVEYTIK